MNEYAAPLVDAAALATIAMHVPASTDDTNHMYNTISGPKIVGVHWNGSRRQRLRTFDRLVAYSVHLTSRQPGISCPARHSDGPARGPNFSTPELVRQDFPSRFLPPAANQGDGPVAAALGEFTYEYRVQRAETLSRDTAEGIGTPSRQFGDNIMKLLLVAQVATTAELARVWHAVSTAPKKLERITLQSHANSTAIELRIPNSAPLPPTRPKPSTGLKNAVLAQSEANLGMYASLIASRLFSFVPFE
jgi:hypothetical protein